MIEQLAEKLIRARVNEGYFDVSPHALQRMAEREIDIEKVLECILQGQTIEFQRDRATDDIKVLFQEATEKTPEIYVVVVALDTPLVITVCRTKDEVWECVANVLKRRGRYSS
jgi:hypothetical protein